MIVDHETISTDRFRQFGWGEAMSWSGAFVVVLAAGASSAFLASTWREEPHLPGAPPPAIMIELAPVAVAPQVEDVAADPGPEAVDMAAAEPIEEPTPEPAEQPEPIEEIEPTEPSDPVEQVVPDLIQAEIAAVTLPMPVTMPISIAQKREEFARQQEQERQERERRRQQQEQQAASQQAAPSSVEAQQSTQTAAPQQTETTRRAPAISPEQWQRQVFAHLNRLKRYPNEARSRREEGVPHLQFTINETGQVLSARIVRSSGFPSLDQAAIDMINRASPVPAPPAGIVRSSMTLTLPINFNLR